MIKPDKRRLLKKLGIDSEKLGQAVEKVSKDFHSYLEKPQQASAELRLSIRQVREDYTRLRPLQVQIDSIRPATVPADNKEHFEFDMSIAADEVVSTPRVGKLLLNDVPLVVESIKHVMARGRHGMRWRLRIAAAAGDEGAHFDTARDQRVSGTLEGGRPFDGCYRSEWARSS